MSYWTFKKVQETMIISVASGKGGTGKTTVAVNLALAVARESKVQFFDCDAEAPNAHLFLKPQFDHREAVKAACPTVNGTLCTFCGRCAEVCAFNALAVLKDRVLVFPELCHDCGGCARFCPENAIGKKEHDIGFVESGYAGAIEFFQGTLTPGEPFAPPIIRALKRKMSNDSVVIVDAPPGTSCPVVEAIQGSDYCLLVAEPTPFGLHDLTLAVELVRKLRLRVGVVINRSDVGDNKVEAFCVQCGICEEVCQFDAIHAYHVNHLSCEGCTVCSLMCPKQAITMEEVISGHLFISDTPYGPLVHAQLEPGEANSGKLVTLVRQTAEKIAEDTKREFIIIDGPPGIGCPVIASITGATAALIVTEPTLSGIRDLTRVLSVCQHFDVPTFVCVNRYDLYEGNTKQIEEFCQEQGIELIGKIPCDLNVIYAIVYQIPVVRYAASKASQEIKELWNQLIEQAQL